MLLNGKRISSFAEIRDLPTEAIARVDILPEEVALKYGYRADQKVVNFVLRRRFRATTVELADRVPTAGGRNDAEGELDLLHIRGDGRFNLHLGYEAQSGLTEDDRDIPDPDPYRSLLPSSRDFTANTVYARPIGKVSATINGRVEYTDSLRVNGLPDGVTDPAPGGVLPLQQRRIDADHASRHHAERVDQPEMALVRHRQLRSQRHQDLQRCRHRGRRP